MFNKKLFLLLASSMMLVACGQNNQPSGDGKGADPASTGEAINFDEIPVEEGKQTMFFIFEDHIAEEGDGTETITIDNLPAYVSPFIDGEFNGWKTSVADGCLEMKRLGDTRIFYAQYDGPMTEDLGYQIVLGYNANSGYGPKKQGIDSNYTYKAMYNSGDNFPGLEHPDMVKIRDGLYHCVSDIPGSPFAFTACPKEVFPVKNQKGKVKVHIPDGMVLGENLEFVYTCSLDGNVTKPLGEPDEEGNYEFLIGEAFNADAYTFQFGIRNKVVGNELKTEHRLYLEAKPKNIGGGTYKEKTDATTGEITSISLDKVTINIRKTAEEGKVHDFGTLAFPNYVNVYGADGKVTGVKAFELPDNEVHKLGHALTINLESTAEEAIDAALIPCLVGELNPDEEGNTWSLFTPMTVVTEGRSWTVDVVGDELIIGRTYKFKIAEEGWARQINDADTDNILLEIMEYGYRVDIKADMSAYAAGGTTVSSLDYIPADVIGDGGVQAE